MSRQLSICDVDDTLVRSAGSKRIPILVVIQHVAELHRDGALLYCWSSGGADYARQSAEEFGIAHYFTAFLPKPHVIIDDQLVVEWPQFLHVHPSSTRTRPATAAGAKRLPRSMRDSAESGLILVDKFLRRCEGSVWKGIVSKRIDSTYEPGERSGAWMKHRTNREQEFVIGGYVPLHLEVLS
jgi:hypothetical protein